MTPELLFEYILSVGLALIIIGAVAIWAYRFFQD